MLILKLYGETIYLLFIYKTMTFVVVVLFVL